MWIVKGSFLGAAFFVVGTIIFLVRVIGRGQAQATGLSVLSGLTINNPFFWVALLACLMLGVSLVASWPVRA
jgi:ABC-type antimicrobial peptide transport system permease subunit